jgi:CheY-like chemotaxis protein
MITRATFSRHVRDALDNLYDPVHLQVHPLIDILSLQRAPSETGGEALRKLLWEAIGTLKPPASVPAHRPEWLSYRLLWLHYVQLLDASAVQRDLGLAERTFYRRLQEAVEAVASILWEGYRIGASPDDDPVAPAPALASPAQLAREKALHLIQDGDRHIVALDGVVASAVETVLSLFRHQGCSLVLDVPTGLPRVCGDPAVLHQIVVNILLAGLETAVSRALTLRVVPQGDRIIWRLYGLSKAKSPQEVMHLGPLVLSRELAASCGGEVWVDRDAQGAPALNLSIVCVQPVTILIVDDDSDARKLLSRLLRGRGYVVREAQGADAVQGALSSTPPDLILLDVLMPQQDGWKLLQRLKAWDDSAAIPVIICSVLSQTDLAMALGAAAVIQKPISEETLIRTVEQVLHRA